MIEPSYLRQQFLIAMPNLEDVNFAQSVTYLCEHDDQGALGVIINRPLELTVGELLAHLSLGPAPEAIAQQPIYYGGPVQPEQGFVLHRPLGAWDSSLALGNDLGLTSSRDILQAISQGQGPEQFLIMLGYAGWNAGQLEQELAHNAWLSGPATVQVLFNTPWAQRWEAATQLLGIDWHHLSSQAGHA